MRAVWLSLCAACCGCSGVPDSAGTSSPTFRFVEDGARGVLHVFEGKQPVLAYAFGDQLPPGIPDDRRRSSYVHPIHGLDGEVLTDDFPRDHHHHRGLSLMWPRMQRDGKSMELWHIRGIRARFHEWITREADDNMARIVVRNEWILENGTAAADETLHLTVHAATARGRAIDVCYELAAREEPIVLQGQVDKGYGGLNLRFAPRQNTVITTDHGLVKKDSDHQSFRWADLSARFAGRAAPSGIAVLVDPQHPGFPPPWTLRPYGDLNVAWPGLEPFTLRPGAPLVLAYRLWVHRGDAVAGGVAEAYEGWRTR